MNSTFQKIKKLVLVVCFFSLILSQKIVHMDGSFDLDGDNLLEFISLELDPDKNVFPTMVKYNEIDSDGYQTAIWEFDAPKELDGYFVDASYRLPSILRMRFMLIGRFDLFLL